MMKTIVYTGPSLSSDDAKAIFPEASYHAPIQCGDIIKALRIGVERIVIIDGYFEQRGAVWHKEILFALSQGVQVYGASSMGALRAAECGPYGMIGFGKVFELYRDNITLDDDEVALVHSDRFDSIITPMVNIRATIDAAVQCKQIDSIQAEQILSKLKRQPYFSRSLFTATEDQTLNEWFKTHYVDQKRLDAIALLTHLRDNPPAAHQPCEAPESVFFKKIFREMIVEPFHEPYDWLSNHEQALAEQGDTLTMRALKRIAKCNHLAMDIAAKAGKSIRPTETFHFIRQQAQHCPVSMESILQNLLIETGEFAHYVNENDFNMAAFQRAAPKLHALLATLAISLAGVIGYMQSEGLSISARYAQRYADEFRRTRSLNTVEKTFEWMAANHLKEQTDFESLINTLCPLHHIVDGHNAHSIGLNTTVLCVDWLALAQQYVLDIEAEQESHEQETETH